ncbi:IS5 family transposase [Pseudomonas syringae pv. syringae]|uniref:IS5 family transposase n=1 Tax=Pseudomonas syringae TaxID=317 RepID=UPI0015E15E95|nr:IS5 family transposase [Pseudomonas syringae]
MAKRHELSNASWELIKDLVSPEQKMGRPRSDDRLVLHRVLWVLCSGAAWRDLRNALGLGRRCISVFADWRDNGTFDRILERLHIRLIQEGLIDLDTWMIDSTAVRATRASSGAGKRGAEEPLDHTLGRSRGGLTAEIHMVCDANGVPLCFMLSPGQALPGKRGRPRKRSRWLLADKGYEQNTCVTTATVAEYSL